MTRGAALALTLLLVGAPGVPPSATPAGAFDALDSTIAAGVRQGVYPGAVVLVGRSTGVLHARGFGHLSPASRSPRPRPDSTLFDLASLTKVVATGASAMLLVDRGLLQLDRPVAHYLPEFSRPSQQGITVRMLLNHTSGLRPYAEYFRLADTRAAAIRLLLAETPRHPPGAGAEYSDLNAMLLGLVIERVTGESLDQFARREIFEPLGMSSTGFNPDRAWRTRTAASSIERGRPVAGVVQDRNAQVLGGVAGHAGLFSTAADLARFAQWWLRRGRTESGDTLVRAETMDLFLSPQPNAGSRLLAWDSPDSLADHPSLFGSLVSPTAFGHTGWTGTQLWVDPARDLFVVFLTNRSLNPSVTRSIRQLRTIRATVADLAISAIEPRCLAASGAGASC